MNSFYGGRPGYSFVIAKSYESIAEMVKYFQMGPEYEAVHFNEYVLINTVDKHDQDNGKIFRRGYDYTNSMGGAQYVGTIVGPSGKAPHVSLDTYNHLQTMSKEEGVRYRYSEGILSVDNKSLVPGKKSDGTFNDVIKWNCYSVRTPNNDDCTAYIGFELPYPVIDYTAKTVDPYYNRDDGGSTTTFNNINLVTREDKGDHPFHEQWHIAIPKGIKGDTFKNLRIVRADDAGVVIQPYTGQDDDKTGHRAVWVIDYYHYDKNATGEPVTQYIGDFNIIDDINIDNDGNVHITYTHNDKKDIPIIWLKGLKIAEDGTVTLQYTNKADDTLPVKVKWLTDVKINTGDTEGTGNQKVHITYNTGENKDIGNPLNYIMKTAVSPDFHLLIKHSDPERRKQIVANKQNYTGVDGKGYLNELDWQDMGTIKDDDGILIGLNLEQSEITEDLSTKANAIKYLNEHYPNGLIGDNLTGKIITIGYADNSKLFYAFDYTKLNNGYKGWYYLGILQLDMAMMMAVAEDTETEKLVSLVENAVWFKVEHNTTIAEE